MENVVIVNNNPKPSRPTGKIVVAVLGLLILVTGVLAGTLLIRQNQDFRERASDDPCLARTTATLCASAIGSTPLNCTWYDCGVCRTTGTSVADACPTVPAPTDPPLVPTKPPTESSSTMSCDEIRGYNAFSVTWQRLTLADLKNLKAGNLVYLTVYATWSSNSVTPFDKARIRINGGAWQETNSIKPTVFPVTGQVEYYISYTIPEGITSFKVEGQVHIAETNTWI